MNSIRWRIIAAVVCEALGIAALVLGVLLGYTTRSIFNSDAFAARVAASLSQPGVSSFVAERIADALIAEQPDLTGVRPLIITAGRGLVASPPFRMAARRAALELHRTIMSGRGEKIMLSVRDVGEIVKTAIALHPRLAAKLPSGLTARIASLDDLPAGELAERLVTIARRARIGFVVLMLLGVGLVATGVMLSRAHRRTLFRVGVTIAVAGVGLWIVARFGGLAIALLARDRDRGLLAAGLWNAFLGGLRVWAYALGLVGIVFASASASLLERVQIERRTRALWSWIVTPPPSRGHRFLRGLGILGVGAAAVSWPLAMLSLVALLAGGVATFIGLRECFAAALQSLPEMSPRAATPATAAREPGWSPMRAGVAGALVVTMVAVIAVVLMRSPAAPEPPEITACNGYAVLCDRRVDQVVFPAAHNAMGGADVDGWMFPSQNHAIPRQLEDGVRGLLIDAHYGVPVGDKVKTIMDNEKNAMAKYEAVLGKEGMAAALRIRDRLVGEDPRKQAVYMAHGFCELGATPLVPALHQIREFLVSNPGEVLIIVIQDEGVAPADIAKCFAESGLIDFVYRGPTGPWPTLREMAESGQRVVVCAENDNHGVAWYHRSTEVMQETPYEFRDTTQFSERPNRGGTEGSLLLMNHWIESTPMPKPSNAEVVNAYDFLLRRARRCEQERHHLPNLIAVDFYGTGDLMRVVQTLNGVGP